MNISQKILQIMGMEIATKLIEPNLDCETKLWRAVINTALEDVMITNQNRTESMLKGAAHDWFVSDSEDFEYVCLNADLDPKYVRKRYLDAIEKGVIFFTRKQNLNIKYTELYERLRHTKDPENRKNITRYINQLRKTIFNL
jgi:hypothetical protein